MANREFLPGGFHDYFSETVDCHHLFRSDVDGAGKIGIHQTPNSFHTLVDVEKRSGLFSIPPDFNRPAILSLRHLPAERGVRLLASAFPSAFGAKILWNRATRTLTRSSSCMPDRGAR